MVMMFYHSNRKQDAEGSRVHNLTHHLSLIFHSAAYICLVFNNHEWGPLYILHLVYFKVHRAQDLIKSACW